MAKIKWTVTLLPVYQYNNQTSLLVSYNNFFILINHIKLYLIYSTAPSQKDLTILKTASLSDVKEECGDGVENCFGFDDDDEETTNSGG